MNALATHKDFPDWLGPVLVKELRQGLRSRVFAAAFYFAQALMVLSVALNLAAVGGTEEPPPGLLALLDGVFWFLIALPMVFLMPFRGFGALHAEMKSKTLELVFLTRLTAWRIASAKWAAIVLQTALLSCAILPYVVLRYFLGGVDLLDDAQKVFFLFVTSAALTAATVAMSPYESKIVRGLFTVGMIFAAQSLVGGLVAWMAVGRVAGAAVAGPAWHAYAAVFFFLPPLVVLAIEMAASRIAPPAENHAIRKRLLALVVLAVGGLVSFVWDDLVWAFFLALAFCAPVVMDAFAEEARPVRSVYSPFLKRGRPGLLALFLFSPGWQSAVWFFLLCFGVAGVAAFGTAGFEQAEARLAFISYFGGLVFPAAFLRVALPGTKNFLGFYLGLQFFFAAVASMVAIISAFSADSLVLWIAWIPTCAFFLNLIDQVPSNLSHFTLLMTGLASLVAFVALAIIGFKRQRDILEQLRNDTPPDV